MNTVLLQTVFAVVNFALVAWILYWKAGPVVAKGLREKNAATRRALDEAEAAQAKAAAELATHRERLANVEAELTGLVAQARTLATQSAQGIAATAEADGQRLRAHAEAEVERERRAAQQAVQRSLLQQALEAAREELRRQMNPDVQRQMVARFIQKVGDGSCPITQ